MNINYCTETIQNMFANNPNPDLDLNEVLDGHFRSIDTSEVGYGREVFSVSRKLARFLLHNCKHEVPDEKQIKKILRVKAHIDFDGMKSIWCKDPILLNNKTKEIKDGITRLYAVALSSRTGVCLPLALEED